MKKLSFKGALPGAVAALCAFGSTAALAAPPRLSLVPPKNTGFLVDQRFDIRGEATVDTGRTVASLDIKIDGTSVTPSPQVFFDAATRSLTVRKFSWLTIGPHTLSFTATDSAGETNTVTKNYNVVNPFGNRKPVKNIIVLLGDGMGSAHKTAARIVRYGVDEGRVKGMLALDTLPNIATIVTHSLNTIVTDSAPGMQNYVTGSKSANNQEGVYPDNTANGAVAGTNTGAFDNPRIEYLSEYLSRKFGKSTGIVSTADIEDATPAANAVHTQNRGAGVGIVDQYFDERSFHNLRVLMGGGRRWFLPAGTVGSARTAGNDYALPAPVAAALGVPTGAIDPSRNLIADFTGDGFTYAPTRTALNAIPASATKVLGLFQYGNMNVALDKINGRRGVLPAGRSTSVVQDMLAPDQPMLDEMTDVALRTLNNNNQNGFYLMVEGASIDKQSHAMDADRAIYEMMEFDNAIRKAVDFANRDGNTLVVVTADHECSGFSIVGATTVDKAGLQALPSDTTKLDPSVAPARQGVVGVYDAAGFPNYGTMYSPDSLTTPDPLGYPADPDVKGKLIIGFGASGDHYEDFLSKPVPFNDGSETAANAAGTLPNPPYTPSILTRLPEAANGMFLRGLAGGNGTQAVHTASEIPLYAYSAGSRASTLFYGLLDNTDVFFLLAKAAAGGY